MRVRHSGTVAPRLSSRLNLTLANGVLVATVNLNASLSLEATHAQESKPFRHKHCLVSGTRPQKGAGQENTKRTRKDLHFTDFRARRRCRCAKAGDQENSKSVLEHCEWFRFKAKENELLNPPENLPALPCAEG